MITAPIDITLLAIRSRGRSTSGQGAVVGAGCKVNAKASPYVTHLPDALAHDVEIRAECMALRVAALRIGDIVLAMGNPLGLTGSVTNGIVSAIDRTVSEPVEPGMPGATLPDVIQTSASINPGNSGGALVDLAGDVVGVPTLAAIDPQIGGSSGSGSAAPGIGFAIPSNVVKDIAGQLIAHDGHITNSHRAALGIGVLTVVDQNGRPTGAGVGTITPGGAAAAAGVRVGEVITAVNGTAVHSARELATVLAELAPGQAVPVELSDPQGGTRTVTIILGQLPGS